MLRAIAVSLCALLSLGAYGQVTGHGLHVASYHSPNVDVNNATPGVYITFKGPGAYTIVTGTYVNSESYTLRFPGRHQTLYAAFRTDLVHFSPLKVDVTAGLAAGYNRASLVPIGMLGLAYRTETVTFRYMAVPRLGVGSYGVHHIAVEFSLP